jgi:chromate transporter
MVDREIVMEPLSIDTVDKAPSLASLFLSFLRLGATAFGGPAMIDYIRRMVVEQKRWLDDASFRDGVAFCQTVPGSISMQSAAYVGLRVRGVPGAAVCFLGFALPAFLVMLILSALYLQTKDLPVIIAAFSGLQAIIVSIVAYAALNFGRASIKNWKAAVITVLAGILFGFGVSPFLVIILAAATGVVLYLKQPGTLVSPSTKQITTTRPTLIIVAGVVLGFAILFLANRGLFNLSALMFRVNLMAFGGGFACIPLMFNEVVNVNSWMDGPTFLNGIALGQVTPGPIIITATFIGYLLYGFFGAAIATLAIFLPSFLMVVGIAPYFDKLRAFSYFGKAVSGILSSFVGLLAAMTVLFALKVPWSFFHAFLAIAAFAALLLQVEVYWVAIAGVALSIIFL